MDKKAHASKGKLYTNFDKHYNEHYAGGINKPNKHISTINLIKSELGESVQQNYKKPTNLLQMNL